MQERCRRAQAQVHVVHFWPTAIEVDGHCFTDVCNAAKELKYWWKRLACELMKRTPNPPFRALLLPAMLCFAFQLVLLIKWEMVRCKPTCLLLQLTAVRDVTANAIRDLICRFRERNARPTTVHT
jgi:hypothetical protein